MPRIYRLSRAEFAHTRTFARVHGSLFSYLYGTIPGRQTPGGAPVISSKTAKTAVARNQVKRRVRAALLPLLASTPPARVIIVIAKKGAVDATAEEIRAEITRTFEKLQ